MTQSIISARIDSSDKNRFDDFCASIGINTSTAINMFVKAVLRENRIPFEIAQSSDPFFSKTNMEHVRKSVQQLRTSKGSTHKLIELDDEWQNMVRLSLGELLILAITR